RSSGSHLQSSVRVQPDPEVRHCPNQAEMADKQVFGGSHRDPLSGINFCLLLYLLRISCFSKPGISVSTLSNVVSNRFRIRCFWFYLAAPYAPPVEFTEHFSGLGRDAKTSRSYIAVGNFSGLRPRSESIAIAGCSGACADTRCCGRRGCDARSGP